MAGLLEPGDYLEDRWLVVDCRPGSSGVVCVLRDLRHDEGAPRPEVVIGKTVRPEFAADAERVALFEQECNTWLSLGVHKAHRAAVLR